MTKLYHSIFQSKIVFVVSFSPFLAHLPPFLGLGLPVATSHVTVFLSQSLKM